MDWLDEPIHLAFGPGSKSLDLKGLNQGTYGAVTTTIPTDVGCLYRIRFRTYGGAVANVGVVSAGDLAGGFFQPAGSNPPVAEYETVDASFTALSTSTVVTFRSWVSDGFGPVIDDVEIYPVPPEVQVQPADAQACPTGTAAFDVDAAGVSAGGYQWQIEDPDVKGGWADLTNGVIQLGGKPTCVFASGANQRTLALSLGCAASGEAALMSGRSFRCLLTNACGSSVTDGAALVICRADFNCDGVVNSTDVSDFINAWFADQVQGTSVTDWDGNGIVNSTDVSNYINDWFEATAGVCG